jgi:hypothetical protein
MNDLSLSDWRSVNTIRQSLRNTLTYSSGVVVAVGEPSSTPPPIPAKTPPVVTAPMSKLSFDEEAKLVYGVIFSLKGMVQKLSGRWAQVANRAGRKPNLSHVCPLVKGGIALLGDEI